MNGYIKQSGTKVLALHQSKYMYLQRLLNFAPNFQVLNADLIQSIYFFPQGFRNISSSAI